MVEEIEHAAVNIPRAILRSMLINGIFGFVMMLTILFCLGLLGTINNAYACIYMIFRDILVRLASCNTSLG